MLRPTELAECMYAITWHCTCKDILASLPSATARTINFFRQADSAARDRVRLLGLVQGPSFQIHDEVDVTDLEIRVMEHYHGKR